MVAYYINLRLVFAMMQTRTPAGMVILYNNIFFPLSPVLLVLILITIIIIKAEIKQNGYFEFVYSEKR